MTIFSSLYGERLSRELGTDDTNLFTTARRKAAINEGQREFNDLTECFVKRATFAVTGGTAEYDLNSTLIGPRDFVRFSVEPVIFTYTDASSHVTYLSGEDLPRRDVLWLDRNERGWRNDTHASSQQQLPRYYYARPDGPAYWLGFTPKPCTGSSASAAVQVPYVALPEAMINDSDEPWTVNFSSLRVDLRPYHMATVHYAAHQLEKFRRDDQASQMQLQKFLGYVSRYAASMRIKGGRTVNAVAHYFNRSRSE